MKLQYIFLSILFPTLVLSQGSSRGVASLKLPVTPFVASTGESFVADPMSVQSILLNPANIASYEVYGIMFAHTEWIQDIRTEFLSVVAPLRIGTISLSIGNTSVNNLELHGNVPGPALGTFNIQSTLFQLTYGVKVAETIRIGISPKYIYEKIFVDDATGFGVDAGVLYSPPVENLILGFSLTNMGSLEAFRNERTDLPSQIKLGGTYSFIWDKITLRTAAAYSSELGISVNHLSTGIEAIFNNAISVRFGYRTGYEIEGFSAGLGIRYSIIIDYAYLPSSLQAGDAHIISIGFTF